MIFQSACCQESTQAARLTIGALAHAASHTRATACGCCYEFVDCTCKVKIFFLCEGNVIKIFSPRRKQRSICISAHTHFQEKVSSRDVCSRGWRVRICAYLDLWSTRGCGAFTCSTIFFTVIIRENLIKVLIDYKLKYKSLISSHSKARDMDKEIYTVPKGAHKDVSQGKRLTKRA